MTATDNNPEPDPAELKKPTNVEINAAEPPDAEIDDAELERLAAAARPLFPHRPWMAGIVLVLAMLAILGGLRDPIWFWVGLPFILVLALTIYVRVQQRFRRRHDDTE